MSKLPFYRSHPRYTYLWRGWFLVYESFDTFTLFAKRYFPVLYAPYIRFPGTVHTTCQHRAHGGWAPCLRTISTVLKEPVRPFSSYRWWTGHLSKKVKIVEGDKFDGNKGSYVGKMSILEDWVQKADPCVFLSKNRLITLWNIIVKAFYYCFSCFCSFLNGR